MQENKAKSTNPFTGEVIGEYNYLTEEEIKQTIKKSWDGFVKYRDEDAKTRSAKLNKLADVLDKNVEKLGKIITMEMGKPIKEAKDEVTKSAKHCRYFAEHLEEFSKPTVIESDAKKSYVIYQALGPIYHITPFNFPCWLVFKGVIPAIAMGNTVINKNPSICTQTGIVIEELFREAGFNNNEYMNIAVAQESSEAIIKNKLIRGVSFTGSSGGGSKIASWAGKYCKKAVMELGGSDPFIVLKDADISFAVQQGIEGRLKNGGQVCIASKRFIVEESIYEEFKSTLVEKVKDVKIGDPMDENTKIGPLAKKNGLENVMEQVEKSKKQGGKVVYGGQQPSDENLKKGFYYMPTVIEVEEGNIILEEETFGPVFALIKFKSEEDAIRMANDSDYGLAGCIFTRDEAKGQKLAEKVEVGSLFINHFVTSGSALPGGGVKESGFGREGGIYGAHEFVNVKTVFIGKGPEESK